MDRSWLRPRRGRATLAALAGAALSQVLCSHRCCALTGAVLSQVGRSRRERRPMDRPWLRPRRGRATLAALAGAALSQVPHSHRCRTLTGGALSPRAPAHGPTLTAASARPRYLCRSSRRRALTGGAPSPRAPAHGPVLTAAAARPRHLCRPSRRRALEKIRFYQGVCITFKRPTRMVPPRASSTTTRSHVESIEAPKGVVVTFTSLHGEAPRSEENCSV